MVTTKNLPIEELVEKFLKKGGHIHKFYLQDLPRSKQSLVHLKNDWFSGRNLREAILKALSGK